MYRVRKLGAIFIGLMAVLALWLFGAVGLSTYLLH